MTLAPARLDEIRDVLAELVANPDGPPEPTELRALLDRCRSALADTLVDRDALAVANAEAGEELALWTGSLR
ncbi:hypothetical protein [Streptomyces sp. NBC_01233]|uniref:hypothetical protein n=1 Tax=Streptomyces sp. NBC_01233 TaxID=2903787 RepID=UPI002E0DE7EA|nr:hypothetical protein OG332_24275 [Streptomyces sp. NBC_01233]